MSKKVSTLASIQPSSRQGARPTVEAPAQASPSPISSSAQEKTDEERTAAYMARLEVDQLFAQNERDRIETVVNRLRGIDQRRKDVMMASVEAAGQKVGSNNGTASPGGATSPGRSSNHQLAGQGPGSPTGGVGIGMESNIAKIMDILNAKNAGSTANLDSNIVLTAAMAKGYEGIGVPSAPEEEEVDTRSRIAQRIASIPPGPETQAKTKGIMLSDLSRRRHLHVSSLKNKDLMTTATFGAHAANTSLNHATAFVKDNSVAVATSLYSAASIQQAARGKVGGAKKRNPMASSGHGDHSSWGGQNGSHSPVQLRQMFERSAQEARQFELQRRSRSAPRIIASWHTLRQGWAKWKQMTSHMHGGGLEGGEGSMRRAGGGSMMMNSMASSLNAGASLRFGNAAPSEREQLLERQVAVLLDQCANQVGLIKGLREKMAGMKRDQVEYGVRLARTLERESWLTGVLAGLLHSSVGPRARGASVVDLGVGGEGSMGRSRGASITSPVMSSSQRLPASPTNDRSSGFSTKATTTHDASALLSSLVGLPKGTQSFPPFFTGGPLWAHIPPPSSHFPMSGSSSASSVPANKITDIIADGISLPPSLTYQGAPVGAQSPFYYRGTPPVLAPGVTYAIVIIDVQGVGNLWDSYPHLMPSQMEILLDQVVNKPLMTYSGYRVASSLVVSSGTGPSSGGGRASGCVGTNHRHMFAFPGPLSACRFACEVHTAAMSPAWAFELLDHPDFPSEALTPPMGANASMMASTHTAAAASLLAASGTDAVSMNEASATMDASVSHRLGGGSKMVEFSESVPPTVTVNKAGSSLKGAPEYLWRGPRLQVGIHGGAVGTLDPATQLVYFDGTEALVAAFLQAMSAGGETLISGEIAAAVSSSAASQGLFLETWGVVSLGSANQQQQQQQSSPTMGKAASNLRKRQEQNKNLAGTDVNTTGPSSIIIGCVKNVTVTRLLPLRLKERTYALQRDFHKSENNALNAVRDLLSAAALGCPLLSRFGPALTPVSTTTTVVDASAPGAVSSPVTAKPGSESLEQIAGSPVTMVTVVPSALPDLAALTFHSVIKPMYGTSNAATPSPFGMPGLSLSVLEESLIKFRMTVESQARSFGGYISRVTPSGQYTLMFTTTIAAIQFSLKLQMVLMEQHWHEELTAIPCCSIVRNSPGGGGAGGSGAPASNNNPASSMSASSPSMMMSTNATQPLLFKGLRAGIGIHFMERALPSLDALTGRTVIASSLGSVLLPGRSMLAGPSSSSSATSNGSGGLPQGYVESQISGVLAASCAGGETLISSSVLAVAIENISALKHPHIVANTTKSSKSMGASLMIKGPIAGNPSYQGRGGGIAVPFSDIMMVGFQIFPKELALRESYLRCDPPPAGAPETPPVTSLVPSSATGSTGQGGGGKPSGSTQNPMEDLQFFHFTATQLEDSIQLLQKNIDERDRWVRHLEGVVSSQSTFMRALRQEVLGLPFVDVNIATCVASLQIPPFLLLDGASSSPAPSAAAAKAVNSGGTPENEALSAAAHHNPHHSMSSGLFLLAVTFAHVDALLRHWPEEFPTAIDLWDRFVITMMEQHHGIELRRVPSGIVRIMCFSSLVDAIECWSGITRNVLHLPWSIKLCDSEFAGKVVAADLFPGAPGGDQIVWNGLRPIGALSVCGAGNQHNGGARGEGASEGGSTSGLVIIANPTQPGRFIAVGPSITTLMDTLNIALEGECIAIKTAALVGALDMLDELELIPMVRTMGGAGVGDAALKAAKSMTFTTGTKEKEGAADLTSMMSTTGELTLAVDDLGQFIRLQPAEFVARRKTQRSSIPYVRFGDGNSKGTGFGMRKEKLASPLVVFVGMMPCDALREAVHMNATLERQERRQMARQQQYDQQQGGDGTDGKTKKVSPKKEKEEDDENDGEGEDRNAQSLIDKKLQRLRRLSTRGNSLEGDGADSDDDEEKQRRRRQSEAAEEAALLDDDGSDADPNEDQEVRKEKRRKKLAAARRDKLEQGDSEDDAIELREFTTSTGLSNEMIKQIAKDVRRYDKVVQQLVEEFHGHILFTFGTSDPSAEENDGGVAATGGAGGGDLFIVFVDPRDGIKFSLAIHERLYTQHWSEAVLSIPECREQYPKGSSGTHSGKVLLRGIRAQVGCHWCVDAVVTPDALLGIDVYCHSELLWAYFLAKGTSGVAGLGATNSGILSDHSSGIIGSVAHSGETVLSTAAYNVWSGSAMFLAKLTTLTLPAPRVVPPESTIDDPAAGNGSGQGNSKVTKTKSNVGSAKGSSGSKGSTNGTNRWTVSFGGNIDVKGTLRLNDSKSALPTLLYSLLPDSMAASRPLLLMEQRKFAYGLRPINTKPPLAISASGQGGEGADGIALSEEQEEQRLVKSMSKLEELTGPSTVGFSTIESVKKLVEKRQQLMVALKGMDIKDMDEVQRRARLAALKDISGTRSRHNSGDPTALMRTSSSAGDDDDGEDAGRTSSSAQLTSTSKTNISSSSSKNIIIEKGVPKRSPNEPDPVTTLHVNINTIQKKVIDKFVESRKEYQTLQTTLALLESASMLAEDRFLLDVRRKKALKEQQEEEEKRQAELKRQKEEERQELMTTAAGRRKLQIEDKAAAEELQRNGGVPADGENLNAFLEPLPRWAPSHRETFLHCLEVCRATSRSSFDRNVAANLVVNDGSSSVGMSRSNADFNDGSDPALDTMGLDDASKGGSTGGGKPGGGGNRKGGGKKGGGKGAGGMKREGTTTSFLEDTEGGGGDALRYNNTTPNSNGGIDAAAQEEAVVDCLDRFAMVALAYGASNDTNNAARLRRLRAWEDVCATMGMVGAPTAEEDPQDEASIERRLAAIGALSTDGRTLQEKVAGFLSQALMRL